MRISRKYLSIFLAPYGVFVLLVFLYPVLKTMLMSFCLTENMLSPISSWKFSGLDNYIKLFHTTLFITSMKTFLKLWIFGGIATILLALVFSIAFTTDLRFKKFFRAIVYLPNVIAAIAVGYMWLLYIYNNRFGFMKTFFSMIRWDYMANFQWLDNEHILLSMTIAFVYGNVGYYMMMYIAGIEKIPSDYYECAKIEGANVFVQFFRITLPLIKGVFSTSAVLWTARTMGFFALSQVFSSVRTYTPMLFTYLSLFGTEVSQQGVNAGMAAASALVMTVIVVVISSLINCVIRDEEIAF